ncbi:GYD domain-containing protein [Streptomyces sp. NPDC006283]|uniref:GYD domain-containing protein n=1 Tax=Streptomyces sp. NPDC006283 TaxID=3156741 RepID=UPI00339E8BF7
MPKYLVQATYTAEGMKGLLAEGGSGRKAAVEQVLTSCGGTLEWMYFALGERDLYAVIDLPDEVTMAATVMAVRATGTVLSTAVPLLSVADIDAAARTQVDFRPPGA